MELPVPGPGDAEQRLQDDISKRDDCHEAQPDYQILIARRRGRTRPLLLGLHAHRPIRPLAWEALITPSVSRTL